MLTNEKLEQLLRENQVSSVVELPKSEIDDLFVSALVVPPQQWTPVYCGALLKVTRTILLSITTEDDSTDKKFELLRDENPRQFLFNIFLIASIITSSLEGIDKISLINTLFSSDAQPYEWEQRLAEGDVLQKLLESAPGHRSKLWGLIEPHLRMISDGHAIINLHKYYPEHRNIIWATLQPHFKNFITSCYQVIVLLRYEQFNDAERDQILAAIIHNLGVMVLNGEELASLFYLDNLNYIQRGRIWMEVEPFLGSIIQNYDQLIDLLACKYFSTDQQDKILRAGFRPQSMISDVDDLVVLLEYSYLNDMQRNFIWTKMEPELVRLIKNKKTKESLLDCGVLSTGQRRYIQSLNIQPEGDSVQIVATAAAAASSSSNRYVGQVLQSDKKKRDIHLISHLAADEGSNLSSLSLSDDQSSIYSGKTKREKTDPPTPTLRGSNEKE